MFSLQVNKSKCFDANYSRQSYQCQQYNKTCWFQRSGRRGFACIDYKHDAISALRGYLLVRSVI